MINNQLLRALKSLNFLRQPIAALSAACLLCTGIYQSSVTSAYAADTYQNTNSSYAYETTSLIADAQAVPVEITVNQHISSSDSIKDITSDTTDSSYDTTIDISESDYITIESDLPMYGIYILWSSEVSSYQISYNSRTIQCGSYGYLHDYIPLDEAATSVTIRPSTDMSVSDIYAYSDGTLPSNVQVWQPPCDNDTDILVLSTHADDEILFLGGVLTNYGGEQGLNVQVAYMCNFFLTEPVRQHEELDGLWECGITHYPVKGDFMDLYSLDLDTAMTQYNYDDIVAYATSNIRRFKPLVCVSQDFNGEYGHGNHRIYARAISDAVNNSQDASFNPESAATYGTWDVPKTYYHLYNENTITLDVDSPLDRFNQRTAVDVLKSAFQKHVSQISYSFNVMDNGYARTYWGNFDSRAFGLYRTTVGYDTGNDMMEHVTSIHEERVALKESAIKNQSDSDNASNTTGDDTVSDTSETTDNNKTAPDVKQLAITLIAILIIGAVICGQAYRTRNLYKKKYNENKDDFGRQ